MNFNAVKNTKPNAVTHEGGKAYTKNPVQAWMNYLFSSYNEDRYYEDASTQTKRYIFLLDKVAELYSYELIAKMALFARNELGMRSISNLTAAWLANKAFENKRVFYRNYCHRPDDVSEVFAALDALNIKKNHSMCRGFGDYISTLSAYEVGKYKMRRREYNMYDIINLTHPKSDVINDYLAGNLEIPETWETKISTAANQQEKNQNWIQLLKERKLGYLALIRNLNNILSAINETSDLYAIEVLNSALTNPNQIKKSLVFPYQIYNAYKNLKVVPSSVVSALEKAFRISIDNVDTFKGNTAILLDVSGSMEASISRRSTVTIKEAGAVYAAMFALKSEDVKIVKFGSEAKVYHFNRIDNVFNQIEKLADNDNCGYGTYVDTAFDLLDKHYKRILLISDMQIMTTGYHNGQTYYQQYCSKYRTAELYSFDLGFYKTQTDNPNNPHVHLLTTLSDKVLKLMHLLENGKDLIKYINENYSYC